VRVRVAGPSGGELAVCFGSQLDVREIRAGTALDALPDVTVAAYVAKYVTKGDIAGLVLPHRLRSAGQIDVSPGLSEHARRLMHTAWGLGGLEPYEHLKLRTWAHQLGFRGHIATKSLRYSTTYAALRKARSDFRRPAELDAVETVTESAWRLGRIGHTPGQAMLARGIAVKGRDAREAAVEQGRCGRNAADRAAGEAS
jgi:hypothetical protein